MASDVGGVELCQLTQKHLLQQKAIQKKQC